VWHLTQIPRLSILRSLLSAVLVVPIPPPGYPTVDEYIPEAPAFVPCAAWHLMQRARTCRFAKIASPELALELARYRVWQVTHQLDIWMPETGPGSK